MSILFTHICASLFIWNTRRSIFTTTLSPIFSTVIRKIRIHQFIRKTFESSNVGKLLSMFVTSTIIVSSFVCFNSIVQCDCSSMSKEIIYILRCPNKNQ
eukprot:UN23883